MNPRLAQLAIHGGPPVLPAGAPTWPLLRSDVHAALEAAYLEGSWGKYHGGRVEQLEQELAQRHGVPHTWTCCSGTFAVELALRALKIAPGNEVVLAGYDFSGNFRAIEAVGARPVLVDIEPQTWCLDAELLERALSPETKAVIVSHLHGGLADMSAICAICREHNVAVVEDACQAPFAEVAGRVAGSWGDVGVLSFGGSKLLTAGRGGALLTSRPDIAQRAKVFCERGNNAFALSELQAAVLLPQLNTLTAEHEQRRQAVNELRNATAEIVALTPVADSPGRGTPVFYKMAWLYDAALCGGQTREAFLHALQAEGVAMDSGFRGFTGRSAARCRQGSELTHSQRATEQTILLHHPVLLADSRAREHVGAAIRKVAEAFASV